MKKYYITMSRSMRLWIFPATRFLEPVSDSLQDEISNWLKDALLYR